MVEGWGGKGGKKGLGSGYEGMGCEYDEEGDGNDREVGGEYEVFDLMGEVSEEKVEGGVDFGGGVGREGL